MAQRFARGRKASGQIAITAMAAATIEAVKFALNAIPNVEGVTLLCAVYGYCLGVGGVIASLVFCCIEMAIFGAGPWLISYFIHWPFIAIVFAILSKCRIKSIIATTATAVILTGLFGVQTSLVDTGLFTGFFDRFWYRFGIIYTRGIAFYVTQVVCNLIVFPLLFRPITKVILPVGQRLSMCPMKRENGQKKEQIKAQYEGQNQSQNDSENKSTK